ncbi:hypothetical protein BHM03_00017150 [Ensete ventricosum]|nr:hypothetical protein BHM03_00017150 [Ensete ventricosum]
MLHDRDHHDQEDQARDTNGRASVAQQSIATSRPHKADSGRSFRLREEFFGSRPAKVFVQKISFKLRVRRLNCVELFYALVAAIGSESRRCLRGRGGHMHVVCMQRWLATARPPVGAADHGLATCIGRLAAATCGHGQLRPARKGQPVAASP